MKKSFRKALIIKTLLVLLTAVAGAYVLSKYTMEEQFGYFYLTAVVASIINILGFHVAISKNAVRNFSTLVNSLFGIKFFAYLTLTLVFFAFVKTNSLRLYYISFIFVVYLLNTLVLLTEVLKFYKTISKNNDFSK